MKISTVPIDSLKLDPDNAKVHPEENLATIEASIRRFGQRLPIVVRHGVVVGGNGTLTVMRRLGHNEIAVTPADDLTADEARALALLLNRSSEQAVWNPEVLGRQLAELSDVGFQPDALGFTSAALEALFPATDAEFSLPPTETAPAAPTVAQRPDHCCLCGALRGTFIHHQEDYTPTIGPHLFAYPLCYPCHMIVHCRFRSPALWQCYVTAVLQGKRLRSPYLTRSWPRFRVEVLTHFDTLEWVQGSPPEDAGLRLLAEIERRAA